MDNMKIIKGNNLGLGIKCDYMAVGNSVEEVEEKIFDHLENEHKETLDNLDEDDIKDLKYRISTLAGRSCGCGAL